MAMAMPWSTPVVLFWCHQSEVLRSYVRSYLDMYSRACDACQGLYSLGMKGHWPVLPREINTCRTSNWPTEKPS